MPDARSPWSPAGVTVPEPVTKQPISIRLDADLLAALRGTGDRWQSRANGLLRAYAAHLATGGRRVAPAPPTGNKHMISIRVDTDVLTALRGLGRGWQTEVNAVLRGWLTHTQGLPPGVEPETADAVTADATPSGPRR